MLFVPARNNPEMQMVGKTAGPPYCC